MGIKMEYTTLYTPAQNGVSEWFGRTLSEAARAMLIGAKLPSILQLYTVETAAYIQNRLPDALNETPIRKVISQKHLNLEPHLKFKKEIDVHYFREFRYRAYVYNNYRVGKADVKAHVRYLIGYYGSYIYRIQILDNHSIGLVIKSRDVAFREG